MKTALVTGITGQDGPYLASHLVEKGYRVFGAYRRACTPNTEGLKLLRILDKVQLIEMELTEYEDVRYRIGEIKPDEVYNLAAQSHVGTSFKQPLFTTTVNYVGVLHLLEAIRSLGLIDTTKFYQASTSEMFGGVECPEDGYDENSRFWPRSPYGVSKLAAHWIVKNYREAYGLHGSCGILFNHESPLRGLNFVTRKITNGLAHTVLDTSTPLLQVGNLDATRDWGHAWDYTRAMTMMLEQDKPDDFVIASGRNCSVRHMIEVACYYMHIQNWEWQGEGIDEKLVDDEGVLVEINPDFYRPSEVHNLKGNSTKAQTELGWEMHYCFEDLIRDMSHHDFEIVNNELMGLKSNSFYKRVQEKVSKNAAPTE